MNYEEKMIRYIASKLIQRKFYLKKKEFPSPQKLAFLINLVIEDLIEKYNKLSLVRVHEDNGLLTPLVQESVDKIKI